MQNGCPDANRSARSAFWIVLRYPAREIIQFLIRMDYRWFAIAANDALLPISCDQERYNANLVALPVERTEEFLSFVGQK